MAERKVGKKMLRNADVLEYIRDFRSSLIKLIPVFEKASIPWRTVEMYDDFDGIAESLFQWLVLYKLENYCIESHNVVPELSKYGYIYKNYGKKSFIQVIPENSDDFELLVLNYLTTQHDPFDTVVCTAIDIDGTVRKEKIETPFQNTKFKFQFRREA